MESINLFLQEKKQTIQGLLVIFFFDYLHSRVFFATMKQRTSEITDYPTHFDVFTKNTAAVSFSLDDHLNSIWNAFRTSKKKLTLYGESAGDNSGLVLRQSLYFDPKIFRTKIGSSFSSYWKIKIHAKIIGVDLISGELFYSCNETHWIWRIIYLKMFK